MNFFEAATLRLKQQLKVTEDKQAAEALGMTGNAWTMRKRREAFPEKELRALAQQRPELGIDVDYVLTGERPVDAKAWLRLKAQLGEDDDTAVAGLLGMTVAQVNAYTSRGAFPTQAFKAACQQHGWAIDVEYVLTGVAEATRLIIDDALARRDAGSDYQREKEIIEKYRADALFRQAVDAMYALAREASKGAD
jgi:hypothetical protein